jgi:hypothetical protein
MFKKTILLQLTISLLAITLFACATSSSSLLTTALASATVETSTEAAPTAALLSEAPSTATSTTADPAAASVSYPIIDTGQDHCYDDHSSIPCPTEGDAFFGQDAQYSGLQARYVDNGDGTVTDLNTGLMWQQDPGEKMTYQQAVAGASSFNLAGYDDWRLPTIKELYSLIQFSGTDVGMCVEQGSCTATPFIDTDYFVFEYGDTAAGERTIDSQWATNTLYVSDVMNGQQAMFGVNFADGRIKGYGVQSRGGGQGKTFFVIYVRGNPDYGVNDFVNNGDGTITDQATGLTWMQSDSGAGLDWEDALTYCSSLDYAGFEDWRLPSAKELHSIVDYSRSPDTSNSAAINPIFKTSTITNEAGQLDYPAFWSSTTHVVSDGRVDSGVYIAFGEALGYMNGTWMDVHGAGAQRADLKSGDPSQLPIGRGPQGDAMRIYNYARCVRGGTYGQVFTGGEADQTITFQPGGNFGGSGLAQGQSGRAPGELKGQSGLLQGAIDACSDLGAGSTCSVGPGSGTCEDVQGQLICVPEEGPQSAHEGPPDSSQQPPGGVPGQQNEPERQPPQEAITACNEQTQGAICQFTAPHGAVTGTCNLIQQQLACVPAGGLPSRR